MSVYDDYQQLNLLGEGSFGKVYKVRSRKDGKLYACKEINYSKMQTKEKELLANECNIMRKMNHPHIVRYIDRYQDKGLCKIYIIMELCQGGDLDGFIKRYKNQHKCIPEEQIWSIFIQMLEAMDYCHFPPATSELPNKVINRDLKPANIFIDQVPGSDKFSIKVGDFGLCRYLEMAQVAKTNVGTPLYMAPELLLHSNVSYDEKVDIWSLGAILYNMAALQPPYVATNMNSLKLKVQSGIRPSIQMQYSADLKNTINMMLQKEPWKRPSTHQLLSLPCIQSRIKKVDEQQQQVEGAQPKFVLPQAPTQQQKPTIQAMSAEQLLLKEQELIQREALISQKEAQIKQKCRLYGINYDLL